MYAGHSTAKLSCGHTQMFCIRFATFLFDRYFERFGTNASGLSPQHWCHSRYRPSDFFLHPPSLLLWDARSLCFTRPPYKLDLTDTSYGACWVSHLPGAMAISLFPMPMYLFPNVGIEVPSEPNAETFVGYWQLSLGT